ncbi:hypothetical protein [Mycobacterium shigaense]|uniref:hypothetical protein n=1 Tax=Mycobacterium shigaense TaxID=722731 RepID=UPI002ADF48F3|nr:hypothetical protein [Mycobacterium shigaense]MEA1122491.1 hypothetical protein [Mycobacterium shigaense]
MMLSMRTIRGAAAGTIGAAAVATAMLFGGTPAANAAPAPSPSTSFATVGPHGPADVPSWGGHGFGGGHGGWGPGGWGRGLGHGGWGWFNRGWNPWW